MGEVAKIQKLGEDLVTIFPKEVIEKLNLEEGCLVDIESFVCSGTSGVRIRPKTDIQRTWKTDHFNKGGQKNERIQRRRTYQKQW